LPGLISLDGVPENLSLMSSPAFKNDQKFSFSFPLLLKKVILTLRRTPPISFENKWPKEE